MTNGFCARYILGMRDFTTIIAVNPRRIIAVLAVIALLLISLSLFGQIMKYVFGHPSVFGFVLLFSVDDEFNVPSFYSGFLLLTCAALLAVCARLADEQQHGFRIQWWALSLMFIYLAFDEQVGIHERLIAPIQERFHPEGIFMFAWVIVALPLVIVFALASIPFLRGIPSRTRNLFLVAGAMYVGGALGMEMVGSWYTDTFGDENLVYNIVVTIEESLEMFGCVAFIYALLDHLSRLTPPYHITVR